MKLILNDGTEYLIDDFNSNSFVMSCATASEAFVIYNTFTSGDNLSGVSVESDGTTVLASEHLISDGMQIAPTPTGFRLILYYHGAAAVSADSEYAQIGRILMGEEV